MANYTPNYQLHQWAPEDKFLRTDFNEDLNKIDTALGEGAAKTAALEAAVSKCGNCRIYTTQYIGTGGSGQGSPCVLTFPNAPFLVAVSGGTDNSWGFMAHKTGLLVRGGHFCMIMVNSSRTWPATWSADGKTVSWYAVNSDADSQFNAAGVRYEVVALLSADVA